MPPIGPNFSPVLAINSDMNRVIAMGPLGEATLSEEVGPKPDLVQAMRAMVYQESSAAADVVATTNVAVPSQKEGVCWLLPMQTISAESQFKPGRAFSVAFAVISNGVPLAAAGEGKPGRLIWWGHPVQLEVSDAAVEVAATYENDSVLAFLNIQNLISPNADVRSAAAAAWAGLKQ